jgi:hypothetical protein
MSKIHFIVKTEATLNPSAIEDLCNALIAQLEDVPAHTAFHLQVDGKDLSPTSKGWISCYPKDPIED